MSSDHSTSGHTAGDNDIAESPVAFYKRILQVICDNRPSGMRNRLAVALGTNRSFVSQLVNPVYVVPIPAQHLETIFEVCHFSAPERGAFLDAYDKAHPGRRSSADAEIGTRLIAVRVPDLGTSSRNKMLDDMIADHARQIGRLLAALAD